MAIKPIIIVALFNVALRNQMFSRNVVFPRLQAMFLKKKRVTKKKKKLLMIVFLIMGKMKILMNWAKTLMLIKQLLKMIY